MSLPHAEAIRALRQQLESAQHAAGQAARLQAWRVTCFVAAKTGQPRPAPLAEFGELTDPAAGALAEQLLRRAAPAGRLAHELHHHQEAQREALLTAPWAEVRTELQALGERRDAALAELATLRPTLEAYRVYLYLLEDAHRRLQAETPGVRAEALAGVLRSNLSDLRARFDSVALPGPPAGEPASLLAWLSRTYRQLIEEAAPIQLRHDSRVAQVEHDEAELQARLG